MPLKLQLVLFAEKDEGQPAEARASRRHAAAAREPADMDAMSLHTSDSEEAGIALGNAPDLGRGLDPGISLRSFVG